jgi:hypothetical protein
LADFNAASLFFLPALPCRPFPLEGFDLFVGPHLCRAFGPAFFFPASVVPRAVSTGVESSLFFGVLHF